MGRKAKPWSYSVGKRPNTVRVFERPGRRGLYVRTWDPSAREGRGVWRKRALGHSDRERAEVYADEMNAKLKRGEKQAERVTLARLFAMYERYRTPRKSDTEQQADGRRIEMWTRFLGAEKDPLAIRKHEWESFQDLRGSGAIDGRGNPVADLEKRKAVRTRAVEADLKWLRWALNWARDWRLENESYLLRENPVRGFEIPTEKNPRRPVASTDRYEAIRKKTDEVAMEIRWEGRRETRRSYLSEMFDIVHGTGRRITPCVNCGTTTSGSSGRRRPRTERSNGRARPTRKARRGLRRLMRVPVPRSTGDSRIGP